MKRYQLCYFALQYNCAQVQLRIPPLHNTKQYSKLRKRTVLLLSFQILLTIFGEAILAYIEAVPSDPLSDDGHGAGVGEILLTRTALVDVVFQHVALQVTRVGPRRIA